MNMTGISAAERTQPGELVRLLCDGLTASGLEARPLRGDGSRLVITCPRARCLLTVSDCGLAEWECCPLPGCPLPCRAVPSSATRTWSPGAS